jgi:RHS repeat-associated protein
MTSSKDGAGVTVTYGYDLDGDQTSIQYLAGTVTRSYDAADRPTKVTDWLGNVITFAYDKDGDLTKETFPSTTTLVDSFSYNNADELVGIKDKKGTSTIASFGYGRNADGLLTSEKSTAVPPPAKAAYGYNSINQLTSDNSASYGYDAADDITKLINGASLSYDASNQLETLTNGSVSTAFSYDQQGNRTSSTPSGGTASTYSWDEANRLIGFTSGTTIASYTYDGDGLRMGKTVNGIPQSFLWDESGSLPLLLSDGTTTFVYGPGGLPVEQIAGSTVLDYHQDQLGSTRLLTNSLGSVEATYTYDPYGNVIGSTGALTSLGFAGQYRDGESGLYYLRARYYDPTTAQFLTRDPAVVTTRSPYGYVHGDPLNGRDPTGLVGISVCLVLCVGFDTDQGPQFGVGTPGIGVSWGPVGLSTTFHLDPGASWMCNVGGTSCGGSVGWGPIGVNFPTPPLNPPLASTGPRPYVLPPAGCPGDQPPEQLKP